MNTDSYIKAYEQIEQADNILLVTHIRPDGDALASICTMTELLEQMKKPYTAYCYDEPPFQFDFLPHTEKITSDRDSFDFNSFDTIVALDCGSLDRTKLTDELLDRKSGQCAIEFDHHPKIDDYANIEVRNTKASATAEVLYDFLRINRKRINKNMANCILTGIATDTAFFLYPSTSNKTVDIASEMLIYGAQFPQIYENTWRNKSLGAMKVWGQAINNLTINRKYNMAVSILTADDICAENITPEELEGIAGFLSGLHGIRALLLLREEKNGVIRGSLRSNHPDTDVSLLAQALGGGGHAKASGFSFKGCLNKTKNGWQIT